MKLYILLILAIGLGSCEKRQERSVQTATSVKRSVQTATSVKPPVQTATSVKPPVQTATSVKPPEYIPLDAKERYFSEVASRYRDCKQTEDCVLWNHNPVNVNGIGPLHNCYIYWKNIPDALQGPGRRYPIRPNYAVCQEGQCVAMFGPSLRNWRLDYRKAMMDAMDPAVPNAPDPECVKNIPKAHLQESERRRRQLRAY